MLLAAGRSTRLGALGQALPKPLVPICGHPAIAFGLAHATTLFVARTPDGAIVGALTLVLFRIPTAVRGLIEDVVVDDAARGQGVATALTHAALAVAAEAGAKTVDLTSRPSREAANRLYQRLGFHLRETNVYRFEAQK